MKMRPDRKELQGGRLVEIDRRIALIERRSTRG
jgi:hypothetical protein